MDWNLFSADVEEEYSVTEKRPWFSSCRAKARGRKPWSAKSPASSFGLLGAVHNGTLSMSQDIDLVETSSNLASIRLTDGNKILVKTSQRSSILSARHHMSNMGESRFRGWQVPVWKWAKAIRVGK